MTVFRNYQITFAGLVFIFHFAATVTNYGRCLTPDLDRALCIELVDCKYLYELLQSPDLSEKNRTYLTQSQCGTYEKKVLICCPSEYVNGADDAFSLNASIGTETRSSVDLLPSPPQCGRVLSNRIYGGNLTSIDEYPWMALISYTKANGIQRFNCGATLINDRYVITAAHCIPGEGANSDWQIDSIRLGEWDLTTNPDCEIDIQGNADCAPEHIDVTIEEIVRHPSYSPSSRNRLHDIALIRLSNTITDSTFIKPICLPNAASRHSTNYQGVSMDVAGWGQTETSTVSPLKLKVTVNGWNIEDCKRIYTQQRIRLESMQMCAGGEDGVDSCRGDSGGGLVLEERIDNRQVYNLVGVVSFGPIPCGLRGWPGVYTKVVDYIDWIKANIRP